MTQSVSSVPAAVGLVIHRSTPKFLAGVGLMVVILLGALGVLWAWWTEIEVPSLAGSRRITNSGDFGALLATVVATLFTPVLIVMHFVPERLILAGDRLQIVHGSGRRETVVVQITYRNIASLALVHHEGEEFIGIILHDPNDPDTFAIGWDFHDTKSDLWHYRIDGLYQTSLAEIHDRLLELRGGQQTG